MKAIFSGFFAVLLMLAWQSSGYGQYKVQSETTFQSDPDLQGVSTQRLIIEKDGFKFKGDHRTDLSAAKKPVDDVISLTAPPISLGKGFSLIPCFIKLGDFEKTDEYFVDLTLNKDGKDLSYFIELGRGMSAVNSPRDYFIGRLSHELFTFEAGLVSKKGYSSLSEFATDRYGWGAFHPKGMFIAIGSEITRTWILGGTTGLKHFGNFTFMNTDRENRNRWFRTQFGVGNVNQNYFCNDNYIVGTSYLVVPPFHYLRFGPISTKGDWGFKVDGITSGNLERYEMIASRKFGAYGNFSIGWQREVSNGNGMTFEYYKDLSVNNFRFALELRYETLYQRGSGFLTLAQTF